MKKLLTFGFVLLLIQQINCQIYIDIQQFKDAGIDINQSPPQDLLNLGIGNCDLELIKSAISKGADLNKQFEGAGVSVFPLCRAISGACDAMLPGEVSLIAGQIRDYGSEVFSGRSASEIRHDYIEIIRFLLQKGTKATVPSDFGTDNTPLLLAAQYRDIEIIRLLLDFKADPNSHDMSGNTALHVLGLPVAMLLISKGARMHKNTDGEGGPNGDTPLTLAKSSLNIIQSGEGSNWRDYPFFNELVNSLKALIDIYSKL
jgi:Ankyrin repeats (3 copies)